MAFGGGSGGGGGAVSTATDVSLSGVQDNHVLTYNAGIQKWRNQASQGGSGGGGGAYALGRVRYDGGWPSTRPSGYAYIDWIKSSVSDPDPSGSVMVPGDTVSEWQ